MTQENINNISEDEIDLKELFNTILKRKKFIFFFTSIITIFALLFALSKPNEYESKTVLMPQEAQKASMGGGLAALAGFAGVNINSGGGISAEVGYSTLLNDFLFMKEFVLKRDIHLKLSDPDLSKNYIFAFSYRGIFDLLNSSEDSSFDKLSDGEKELIIYDTVQSVKKIISISTDKKSSLLTISAKHSDAVLARDLVNYFLEDASSRLRENEMKDNDKKIEYYDQALRDANDISLKSKLAELSSALIEKKVLANSSEYYNLTQLSKAEIPFYKDKAGPKRALILVVSFVTGLILSIFLVFFLEFIKQDEKSTIDS